MNYFKSLLLISLAIHFCFGNEFVTPFLLTQNLTSESFLNESIPQKDSTGIIQKRRRRRHPAKPTPERVTLARPIPRGATVASVLAQSGIIFAEFGGGFIGETGGLFIGALSLYAISPKSEDIEEWPGLLLGLIGVTSGCSGGTCLVGSAFHQRGRFLPTLTGATLGLAVAWSIGWLSPSEPDYENPPNVDFRLLGLQMSLPPLGAVIGYNLSRRSSEYAKGPIWNKFDPPSFCFRTEMTEENKIIPALDFRLVNARF